MLGPTTVSKKICKNNEILNVATNLLLLKLFT